MRALVIANSSKSVPATDAIVEALAARGFRVERRGKPTTQTWDVVVHWNGASPVTQGSGLTLNPAEAVRLATTLEESAFLLQTHGIPVSPHHLPRGAVRPAVFPPLSEMSSLRVHVGDLRILAVEGDTNGARLTRWREQRMMEAACRAVYVHGLHFGCVHILLHTSGRWYVSGVDPHPNLSPELARAYGSSIAQLSTTWHAGTESNGDAILGADPEFALFTREGRILYASRYVKHSGTVGFDRQSRANRGSVFPLVEVRPNPSPSPHTLFANTQRALAVARTLLPHRRTLWVAGSYPFGKYPTGGHIHFSGLPLTTPLLMALDQYLALPTMLLEQRARGRRRRQKYGRLGDFRRKEHGGFEYRTLASWLVTPEATRAVLCLAKVIADEWQRLPTQPALQSRQAREFYRSKKIRFRQAFSELWRSVMHTQTAKEYEHELSYIPRAVRDGLEWKDESDLKAAWW